MDTTRESNDGRTHELVGQGKYALRIEPAAALLPGTSDPRRLLTLWYVRKCFYWLLFLGYAVGTYLAYLNHESNEIDVEWTSPSSVQNALLSPWSAVVLALMMRFIVGWIALATTAPLVLGHEPGLSPRTNVGSGIGKFFDRLNIARAFRALRWSHHVREIARQRLGRAGDRIGKLDPILDVTNIVSGVVGFAVLYYVATQTAGG